MRTIFTLASACAFLVAAAPASAQLVGGSGRLGGSLGGTLGGTTGGLGNAGGTLGSSLGGRAGGSASVDGGRVGVDSGASGALGTGLGVDSGGGRIDLSHSVALGASTGASVDTGTVVRDTSGRVVGRVQGVRRTATGAVESVAVQVGDRIATLPAANFGVTGDILVSAMGRSEIRREAQRQQPRQSASRTDGHAQSRSNEEDAVRQQ